MPSRRTINTAMTNNWPVHIPAGTYKVTSQLTIDYAGQASKRLPPDLARRRYRWPRRSGGPVPRSSAAAALRPARPAVSISRKKGSLFIDADTNGLRLCPRQARFLRCSQLDQDRSSGRQQRQQRSDSRRMPIQLCARQRSFMPSAMQRAAALEWRLSRPNFRALPVPASASGSGGRGLVLENGYNFSNTF